MRRAPRRCRRRRHSCESLAVPVASSTGASPQGTTWPPRRASRVASLVAAHNTSSLDDDLEMVGAVVGDRGRSRGPAARGGRGGRGRSQEAPAHNPDDLAVREAVESTPGPSNLAVQAPRDRLAAVSRKRKWPEHWTAWASPAGHDVERAGAAGSPEAGCDGEVAQVAPNADRSTARLAARYLT